MSVVYIDQTQDLQDINLITENLGNKIIILLHEMTKYNELEKQMYILGIPHVFVRNLSQGNSSNSSISNLIINANYILSNDELVEESTDNIYDSMIAGIMDTFKIAIVQKNKEVDKFTITMEKEASKNKIASNKEKYKNGMKNYSSSKKSIEKTLKESKVKTKQQG